jgi:hypothetical protein
MSDARLDQFKADIADMKIRDPAVGRESLLLWVGIAGLVVGIAVTVIAYFLSKNSNSPLDQADDHIVALIGVAVTVAGAAVFIRYSVAAFLRFWLARLIYEQRVQTDRLVTSREESVRSTV